MYNMLKIKYIIRMLKCLASPCEPVVAAQAAIRAGVFRPSAAFAALGELIAVKTGIRYGVRRRGAASERPAGLRLRAVLLDGGLFYVALGGALGAAGRYLASALTPSAAAFPWTTLGVNLAGCLGIGLAWGAWSHLHWFQDWGRALLVVGALGGFTTFSAFSMETLQLIASQRWGLAGAYAVGSLVGCVLAAWLGYRLAGH